MPAVILEPSVENEAGQMAEAAPPFFGQNPDAIKTHPGTPRSVATANSAAPYARDRPHTVVVRPKGATSGQKVLAFAGVFVAILLLGGLLFVFAETQDLLPLRHR
jgi:hypothetical protein